MRLTACKYYLSFTALLVAIFLMVGPMACTKNDPPPIEEPLARLLDKEDIQSQLLHQAIRYAVLLPENYYTSTDSFPVVYLLHGFGDNHTAWYQGGAIQHYADKLADEIVPMIFVMPSAYNSYYVNKQNGSFPYMDMITKEFVPLIDSLYRTKNESSQRAVMGYSMGGYGALILPAKNPDVFGVSVPLSMSFRTDEQYILESQDGWNYQWGSIFGGSGESGTARLNPYYKENSPFHFFDQTDVSAFSQIKFMIHCGDDEESLHIPAGEMHDLMQQRGIAHEFRVGDGGHSWNYWHGTLNESLGFISSAFEGIDYPENPKPVSIGEIISDSQYTQKLLNGTTLKVGIFTPPDYDATDTSYSSIFFFHDSPLSKRIENAKNTLSVLNNRMLKGNLTKSLIIEIPVEEGEITRELMTTIMEDISQNYGISTAQNSSVFMANGDGGKSAIHLMADFPESCNACFLYNAQLPDKIQVSEDIYYYVNTTDKAEVYRENFNLYIAIREAGNEYEYRVDHGADEYQNFLNGLDASVRYLTKHLK